MKNVVIKSEGFCVHETYGVSLQVVIVKPRVRVGAPCLLWISAVSGRELGDDDSSTSPAGPWRAAVTGSPSCAVCLLTVLMKILFAIVPNHCVNVAHLYNDNNKHHLPFTLASFKKTKKINFPSHNDNDYNHNVSTWHTTCFHKQSGVNTNRVVGLHLNSKLDWSDNTEAVCRKEQSRLIFLRRKMCALCIASVIFLAAVCWGVGVGSIGAIRLNKLVMKTPVLWWERKCTTWGNSGAGPATDSSSHMPQCIPGALLYHQWSDSTTPPPQLPTPAFSTDEGLNYTLHCHNSCFFFFYYSCYYLL